MPIGLISAPNPDVPIRSRALITDAQRLPPMKIVVAQVSVRLAPHSRIAPSRAGRNLSAGGGAAPSESLPETSRTRWPSGWLQVDLAVDALPDEIGVAGVPRILLDEVDEDPPQREGHPLATGRPHRWGVQTRLGERPVGAVIGHSDGPVVEREELLRRVRCGGVPLPVRVGVPVHAYPGLGQLPDPRGTGGTSSPRPGRGA